MPAGYAEARNIVFPKMASAIRQSLMKKLCKNHVMPRTRPAVPPVRLGLQRSAQGLIAEWQQHGPGTFGGHAPLKLRLSFAPPLSATTATAG